MLESLFGNVTIEKIFLFLFVYGEGYPKKIADVFDIPVNGIQQQFKRMEDGGIVVSKLQGKTRVYQFNPRFVFLDQLKTLLQKAVDVLPEA